LRVKCAVGDHGLLGRPVQVRSRVLVQRIATRNLELVHTGSRTAVYTEPTLKFLILGLVVGLEPVITDDVGVAAIAVGDVVNRGGLFLRDGTVSGVRVHRVLFELEAGICVALVISEAVEPTIAKYYIAVTTRAIAGICSVFNVFSSVQVKHMSQIDFFIEPEKTVFNQI
jgi:hypothetical protein